MLTHTMQAIPPVLLFKVFLDYSCYHFEFTIKLEDFVGPDQLPEASWSVSTLFSKQNISWLSMVRVPKIIDYKIHVSLEVIFFNSIS